jgi:hypothetical protein
MSGGGEKRKKVVGKYEGKKTLGRLRMDGGILLKWDLKRI